jgi:hypothetical protein
MLSENSKSRDLVDTSFHTSYMFIFKGTLQLFYRVLVKYTVRKQARKPMIYIDNATWNSTRNTVLPKTFNTSSYTTIKHREN